MPEGQVQLARKSRRVGIVDEGWASRRDSRRTSRTISSRRPTLRRTVRLNVGRFLLGFRMLLEHEPKPFAKGAVSLGLTPLDGLRLTIIRVCMKTRGCRCAIWTFYYIGRDHATSLPTFSIVSSTSVSYHNIASGSSPLRRSLFKRVLLIISLAGEKAPRGGRHGTARAAARHKSGLIG